MAAYTNTHRTARISPLKVRPMANLIRNKPVNEALDILEQSPKRAAVFLKTGLRAAISNADQAEALHRNMRVVEVRVDAGPTIKRFQPKDRGRAHPIKKRTSHILVSVG